MAGHNYALLTPSATANIGFGGPGSVLAGVFNQSLTAQTNSIAVYDAPASATASPTTPTTNLPNGYPLLFRVTVGAGNSGLLGNLNLKCNYGFVIVPAGAMNGDGGLTFLYD
jgi:hypothetical protein